MARYGLLARSALTLSMLAMAGPLVAQTTGGSATGSAGDTSPESPEADDLPEEIIVTAQRREQVLADVPQSISVVGGETLERQQARSFQDYAKLVPGLSLTQENPGETRLILRGVNTGSVSSTVANYVDDVPFGASGSLSNSGILAGDFDTFDVARIEVLRGPQGTLYGSNALGGVLKFITAAPNVDAFELRAQAGLEDTRYGGLSYSANAVVNIPLGDTLAFRASGFYRDNSGYIDAPSRGARSVNANDSYGGRASLLFEPNEDVSIRLFGLYQKIGTESPSSFLADPATLLPVDPITGTRISKADRQRFERIAEFNKIEYQVYSATFDFDLGFGSLTSVTSHSDQTRDQLGDVSTTEAFRGLANLFYATTAPNTIGVAFANDVKVQKFTQELRLQSQDNDRFEWLIGGYYTDENTSLIQELLPFNLATEALVPTAITVPATFPIPPFRGLSFQNFVTAGIRGNYEEVAAFASATFKFSDRFDITAGGRYSRNDQSSTSSVIQLGNGVPQFGDSSEDVFTYSVSPRFEFSDRASIYARVAKGFRPGGPNFIPPGAGPEFPTEFNSDSLVSYEIGFRGQTPDRLLALDASIYYIDWDDILISSAVLVNGQPTGVNANGRRARVKGGEFTATLNPLRGLTLIANGAYIDSELRDDTVPVDGGLDVTGGLRGDRLPYSPKLSGTLSAEYEWEFSDDIEAFIGADARYVGKQTAEFDAGYREQFARRIRIDDYRAVDLRAGGKYRGFTIQAFARNLFDEEGVVSAGGFPFAVTPALGGTEVPLINVAVIRPRTIGLTVGVEF